MLDHPGKTQVTACHGEQELVFRLLMGPQRALLRPRHWKPPVAFSAGEAWIREHNAQCHRHRGHALGGGAERVDFHRRFNAVSIKSALRAQSYWLRGNLTATAHSTNFGQPIMSGQDPWNA
ncbi:hypothetical protein RFM52_29725 [Mesorhizobium sp. VK2B]|uniref:Uncharacterized protein n=1 Tax=Mesorhizobium humile TaxID=3072313 RepID=A0ABU4YQU7_9HYPH|nr:hypothetical protein [Mesorhizobium sp. VK2B]